METSPNESSEFCCKAFTHALEDGTDSEEYECLMRFDRDDYFLGSDLPAIEFCPWCGKSIENALMSKNRMKLKILVMLFSMVLLIGCTPARFVSAPASLISVDNTNYKTRVLAVSDNIYDVFVKHTGFTWNKDHFELRQDAIKAATVALASHCANGSRFIDAQNQGDLAHLTARFECK